MGLLTGSPTLRLTLPPVPESATRARRALVQYGLEDDLQHTLTLLVTEIVANSIRHAAVPGDVHLAVTLEPGFARVEVLDRGPGFTPGDGGGLGLRLLDKLASRWGVESNTGTVVWFEIDRRRRRFAR